MNSCAVSIDLARYLADEERAERQQAYTESIQREIVNAIMNGNRFEGLGSDDLVDWTVKNVDAVRETLAMFLIPDAEAVQDLTRIMVTSLHHFAEEKALELTQ